MHLVKEGGINNTNEEGRRKQGDSFIIQIGGWKEVRVVGEDVRAGKKFARDMDHFQVKVEEVKKPMGLPSVKGLELVEIDEDFVIGEDLNRKWRPMKVMSPGFQGMDDS